MNKAPVWKTIKADIEKMQRGDLIEAEKLVRVHGFDRNQIAGALNHAMQRGELDATSIRQGYAWRFIGLGGRDAVNSSQGAVEEIFTVVARLNGGGMLLQDEGGQLFKAAPIEL